MQHLDDLAFGAAIGPGVRDAADGAVSIHRAARIVAADVEVALHAGNRAVGNEETVSIAVDADAPGDELPALRCGDVMLIGELDQIAAPGETVDGGFDRGAVIAFDTQFPEEMFEAGFPMRLLYDVFEQRGVLHVY